jgi:DNA-binding NarL/FixJ family response regulator
MTLRVSIVEDVEQLRVEFVHLVSSADDMTCVGAFPNAEAALAALPALSADAVLMDINLPGMNGIECVRRLVKQAPQLHVVMLTAFDDADSIFESLQAGATGYVLKRAPVEQILGAVREACSGGAPMSGSIARKVVQFFNRRGPAPEVDALSERELAVLTALSKGQQYKEIADTLSISINTVRKHIKSIYEKLQVNSRADAVKKLGGS